MSGIRAEVRIEAPPDCYVAAVAERAGATASSVSKATGGSTTERVTEEFVLDDPAPAEEIEPEEFEYPLETVFRYDSGQAYRFERPAGYPCPCDFVELSDCPLQDVHARDGGLILVFHAADIDALRSLLTGLKDRWSNVSVNRLVRSSDQRAREDLVLVDRGVLTDRQAEVLETAHEMGYFDHPRGANAGEVADELDVNATTFTEHLTAAQGKLFAAILDE